jgi:predicted amidohydrolase YtcJ
MGYDQALLAERRHPTRDDLDEVSQDLPVIAVHQSGHLGAVNSKALEILGWTKDTIDPDGGVIRRRSDGEPDGVLEEAAIFMALFPIIESLSPGQNVTLLEIGQRAYVKFGFTTAQEGRALPAQVAALRNASEQNRLVIDVVAYPDVFGAAEVMFSNIPARDYQQHFRIGGGKISLDGSPQGKTAWLSKPYFHPPEGQDSSYVGYPAASDTTVEEKIADAQARGIQILAHVNGDAAADQLISAVTKAIGQHGKHDHRHVAIHSQVLREDQLDAFMALGIIPSFFSLHTFYWGDWHRDETLGPERASRISPANSAIARDMIFTAHHDAPVGLPSSIMIIASLVNRTTRSGKVLGAEQRISVLDALRSITSHAAYQYHEEHNKGSIEAGKLADFVILDKNPLKVSSEELWNLKVLQTIKEDQTVFQSL